MCRNKEDVIKIKAHALFSVIIMACIGFIIKSSEIILPVVLQGWRGTLCFPYVYSAGVRPSHAI